MNERIRELAEQASKDNSDGYPVTLEYSNRFAEKFAELIVRECLERGDVLAKHYIDNQPEQEQAWLLAAVADYSNEIKKHFGVEE